MRILSALLLLPLLSSGQIFYAGTQPGKAGAKALKHEYILQNNVLQINYSVRGGRLARADFENRQTRRHFNFDGLHFFHLVLNNGSIVYAKDFKIKAAPYIQDIPANPHAVRLSERDAGKKLSIVLYNDEHRIALQWQAVLRDNSNYIQNIFTFKNGNKSINKLYLINMPSSPTLDRSGIVDGLPLLDNGNFFSIENPMSKTDTAASTVSEYLYRAAALQKNDSSFYVSHVFGVTPEGQLRRGFLYYVERERAQPYSPFLHYNSWYDLSWGDTLRLREADCLDRIQTWSDSLTVKRGIQLNGYLWDDGWDDYNTLWKFNKHLPNGFKKMYALSGKYGASMGAWISPWGGYMEPKQKRLAFGRQHVPPYETNANGFSLAGKNYFSYFERLVENFITQQHVAIFKFDGIGAGAFAAGAGTEYQGDIQALLRLLTVVRKVKPDIYVSLTAGTWASPYFLMYGNNIWHGGGDYDFVGDGNKRQRWLNYRDYATYQNVVSRSKLYPLNAIMIHGIIDAQNGWVGTADTTDQDMSDDIWSFFGNGTSLQEMYINPHYLNSYQWNVLAKAIKWSRAHKDVLPDVHWVGGNPKNEEVYGFASWNPKHGTLMLRNPSDKIQQYTFRLQNVLELPQKYNGNYKLHNVVKDENVGIFNSQKDITITLQPFEVKVMNVNKSIKTTSD